MDYRLKNSISGKKTWADVLTNIEITKSELVQGNDIPIFLGVATKGYLIMREQLWRRFVVLFSITNLQLRAHYMDRSGMIISQPVLIGPSAMCFVDVLNAMTLSDLSSLGFDPTIHVCTDLCSTGSHSVLPEGVDVMPEGTKGWVMDNDGEVYWIMATLWKSREQNLQLKDCWVDAESLDHEVMLLRAVDGIPNVVTLKKYWDVQYTGQSDCTLTIHEHIREYLPEAPIYSNKSLPELVNVFQDLVVAHEAMVTQRNILHGDLSPNNIIIYDRKGYFIDFDHAKFLTNRKVVDSRGTGTVPYISYHLLKLMGDNPHLSVINHRASDDLESLFYIFLEFTTTYEGPSGKVSAEGVQPVNAPRWRKAYLTMDKDGLGTSGSLKKEFLMEKCLRYDPTPYFQACRPILEEWRKAIGDALHDEQELSHKEILNIIQQQRIQSLPGSLTLPSVASLPASSVTTPPPTSLPLPARPHHPTSLPPASLPPPIFEAMTQDTHIRPHHLGRKMQTQPSELPSTSSVTRDTISPSASGTMAPPLHSPFPPLLDS
ncbi:hypothetical protein EV702DRAFT_1203220 [Suillus placidus]|uniref:Protein kinase domain-containing protein n=1 Tax=Suillus placidus TaxID=48579 RepID=A0A9P6ZJ76_9AGAM|nr:hypothetical protein EV702DRAFT_1203220 [Suillus placidus]